MMLTLSDVDAYYNNVQALFGLDLFVNHGEIVTLMGRNGMGKTTAIRTIMGMVDVRRGHIEFDGKSIRNTRVFRIARSGIGLVPEGRQIFSTLTVEENLTAMAANRFGRVNGWVLSDIYRIFPRLDERRAAMGHQLSGGEQQLLAIGRALMTNPKLLILDEATEGLSPIMQQEVWRCLEGLKAMGQSILVVDKNIEELATIASRHYILEKGKVVWSGDSASLMKSSDLFSRYMAV